MGNKLSVKQIAWLFPLCLMLSCAQDRIEDGVTAHGPLLVANEQLNLGSLAPVSGFQVRLPIKNITSHEVHVTDVQVSCACTNVTPKDFIVPASGTFELETTLDLTKPSVIGENSSDPFSVSIVPVINGQEAKDRSSWTLTGTVHNALDLETVGNTFGSHPQPGKSSQYVTIATCSAPIADLSISGDDKLLQWTVEELDNGRRKIQIAFRESCFLDEFVTIPVDIRATVADKVIGCRRLMLSGRTHGCVRVTPRGLHLVAIDLNGRSVGEISVKSKDGEGMLVEAAMGGPQRDEFRSEVVTIDTSVQKVVVTCVSKSAGLKQAVLTIKIALLGGPHAGTERQVDVPLSCHVAPDLS